MSLSKTNKSVIHKLTSNKVYTTLTIVLFGILLATLVLFIVKKFGKCSKCCLSSESFDNSMIVSAKTYDTTQVKYKDRVYMVKDSDFTVNDDSIRLHGVVKKLKVDDIIIGEEAPGFMRKITKVIRGKNDTLLMTVNVDIDKVLSEGSFDQVFSFKDFVITGKDSSKFNLEDDGIKISEKFDIDATLETTFEKVVTSNFSRVGLNVSLTGTVTFTPTIIVKGSTSLRGVNSFNLETSGNISFSIEVPIKVTKKLEYSNLKRIWPDVKSWTGGLQYKWSIPICPGVWITIKPSIDGNVDFSLTANLLTVNTNAMLYSTQPFFVKFSYMSEREQSRLNQRLVDPFKYGTGTWKTDYNIAVVDIDPRLTCDVNTGLSFNLDFLLWGNIGPYISLKPQYKINVESDLSNALISQLPRYNMTYGPALDIHVGGRFFTYSYNRTLYENWWSRTTDESGYDYDLELPEIIID